MIYNLLRISAERNELKGLMNTAKEKAAAKNASKKNANATQ